jgi:hypothetical protein
MVLVESLEFKKTEKTKALSDMIILKSYKSMSPKPIILKDLVENMEYRRTEKIKALSDLII